MTSSCHRCGVLGFFISALVHLAVAAAVLEHGDTESAATSGQEQVPVTLAMFEAGSAPESTDSGAGEDSAPAPEQLTPEQLTDSEVDSEPAPTVEMEPIPKPEPKPASEPEVATEPEPALAPKPEPVPEQKILAKPKPKPKPQSKPKPRSKHAEKPRHKSKRKSLPPPRHVTGRNGETKGKTGARSARGSANRGGSHRKGGAGKEALERAYLAGLRQAIAGKRHYPASARRAGRTGVATVYFVLDRNGRISGARLAKSSGSGALDRAAVETLRRLARYKPIPAAIGRTRWPLRVPIRFALK
jgi:periplasmic protein TonB